MKSGPSSPSHCNIGVADWSTAVSTRKSPVPPAPSRHAGPDGFQHAKGPGALQEAIGGAEQAGEGKGQNVPRAPVLQRVGDEPGGTREETENREQVHGPGARYSAGNCGR